MFADLGQWLQQQRGRLAEQLDAIEQAEAAFQRLRDVFQETAQERATTLAEPSPAGGLLAGAERPSEQLTCEKCSREFPRRSHNGPRARYCDDCRTAIVRERARNQAAARRARADADCAEAAVALERLHQSEFANGSVSDG
jgi:hypothetical protein